MQRNQSLCNTWSSPLRKIHHSQNGLPISHLNPTRVPLHGPPPIYIHHPSPPPPLTITMPRGAALETEQAAPDLQSEACFPSSRRKRTSNRLPRQHPLPSLFRPTPPLPPPPPAGRDIILDLNRPAVDLDQNVGGLRFLLQKELRNSDVGSLGRIVLPKKEAEAHLPSLTAREGISLTMNDMETTRVWTFKYRFWPNNKSRMYILENTGDFVKTHGLRHGDYIVLYKDDFMDKFVIRGKKVEDQGLSLPPIDDGVFDSIEPDFVVTSARYSDLFLPLADGVSMAVGLNLAFSADFTMGFTDDNAGNCSDDLLPRLGSIENLSLDDEDFS